MERRALAAGLSGHWEGKSTSRNNDPTYWTDCTLLFYPWNEEDERYHLRGQGMSLWRGKRIRFEVRGRYNATTGELTILKQHHGPYTNSVEYSAVVIDGGVIEGTYNNGTIRLTRGASVCSSPLGCPYCLRLLCGEWEGQSISRSNDPTTWSNTTLTFAPQSSAAVEAGTISGCGVAVET